MDEEEEVTLNLAGDGDAGAGGALAALFAPPPPPQPRKQAPAAKPRAAAPAPSPAAAAPVRAGGSGAAGKPAPPNHSSSANGVAADKLQTVQPAPSSTSAAVASSGSASAAVRSKDRVRVPLLYPAAATGGSDAAAAASAAVSASTRPQNTLDPAVAAAKQAAARAAIRDALGVAPAAVAAGPAAAAVPSVDAGDGRPAHRAGAAAGSAAAANVGAGHPLAAAAAKAAPAALAPAKAAMTTTAAVASASAPSAAGAPAGDAAAAAAAAARLVPPGAEDDVTGWLACDDFGTLGLEARLVTKLTAAKQSAGGGSSGVLLGAGAPLDDAAGTAVSRGHTRDGFGLSRPTRVQRLFVPPALAGRSLCAKSETGSGKTLAFLAPIVHALLSRQAGGGMSRSSGLFALVLAPTRELCQQIFTVASRLLQPFPFLVPGLVAGGEKRKAEKARLRKGVSLLVATPGRLCDHLRTTAALGGPAGLASTQWLVLDEADRLLDMGFGPQIAEVVAALRKARGGVPAPGAAAASAKGAGPKSGWTTYLLSATLSSRVRTLAASVLADGDTATLLDATALGGGAAGPAGAPPPWMTSSPMDEDDDDSDDDGGEGGGEKGKAAAAAAGGSGDKDKGGKQKQPHPDKGAPRDLVTPSRLTQQYVVGALKWRLPTLLALLVDAVSLARKGRKAQAAAAVAAATGGATAPPAAAGGGVKLMLFMATCEGVDLHAALLDALLPGMLAPAASSAPSSTSSSSSGGAPPPHPPTVRVLRLHGDLPQGQRTAAVRAFASPAGGASSVSVLVTTDVAARGLDLPSVDAILQADPPSDTQDYVHRVGRTARAGASGRALLLLQPHEAPYVELLAAAGLGLHRADPAPAFAALARCPVPAAMLGGGGGSAGNGEDGAPAAAAAGGGGKGGARKPAQPAAGHKRKRPEGDEGSDADVDSDSNADEEGGGDNYKRRGRPLAPSGGGGGGSSSSSGMARKLASLMEAAERARAVHSRSGGGGANGGSAAAPSSSSSGSSSSSSRWAELQAVLWQTLIEGIVATHVWAPATGAVLPAASSSSTGSAAPQPTTEPLVDLARRAFASFVRAYATHEKATRHIFHPRALHLGHAAKACGLTEQPTQVVARSAKAAAKRARVEAATGGGDKEAPSSSAAAAAAAGGGGGGGDGRKGKGAAGGKKQPQQQGGGGGKGGGKRPAGAAAAPPSASKPGSSHNRLSWKPPRGGDRDDDRDGASGGGGGDPGTIKTQLLSKARQVEGRKARMSEFEA